MKTWKNRLGIIAMATGIFSRQVSFGDGVDSDFGAMMVFVFGAILFVINWEAQ